MKNYFQIPVQWKLATFRDVCVVNQGLQIAIADRFQEPSKGRKLYITVQYINTKSPEHTYYIQNPRQSVTANENDILMTRTGNTGLVITGVNGVFHNNFFKIDFDREKLNKDFLFYFLNLPRIQYLIATYAGTSTIPDLNHGDFYSLPVLIPLLEEQKAIAKILVTWDEAIEIVEEMIEKNNQLFRSILYKTVRTKKDTNCKLGQIAKVKHGKSQKKVENESGRYPILATGGIIGYADKYLTDKPSVLIGRKGTIDKPGFMNKPFWHVDTLFRIETSKKVLPKWLYYYFLTVNWQAYNQGAVLPSLTGSSVESIKLFLPELEKQESHIQLLDVIESRIYNLKKKKELLSNQKKGLMQRLLTGKVKMN